jgi:hypothetical protein
VDIRKPILNVSRWNASTTACADAADAVAAAVLTGAGALAGLSRLHLQASANATMRKCIRLILD